MDKYVLEVYKDRERVASLDSEGNWVCTDYDILKEVVSETSDELFKRQGLLRDDSVSKVTSLMMNKVSNGG